MSSLDQLTKKNQEFIHIATNQLIADGKTDSDIKTILEENLPIIIEAQKRGETARHLLGAPTVWAAGFSRPQTEQGAPIEKNTNPYLMWLDMVLLLTGVMALINIVAELFGQTAPQTRLVSFLSLVLLGGGALYANYYFIYRHLGKPRHERPKTTKSLLWLVGSMGLWVILSSLTALLPDRLNPIVPVYVLAVLGAIAFAARFYLKRKYNIQSAMATTGK